MRKIFLLLLVLLTLFSCEVGPFHTITIYHTNDPHGWIYPKKAILPDSTQALRGGFAVLANYLKGAKSPYLLIDAGDLFQGTPEGNLTGGTSVVDIMNALNYDIVAPGNHEFDYGFENFFRLDSLADFPFLCDNVIDSVSGEPLSVFKPYEIREINGIKVGFFGLLTPDTRSMSDWDYPGAIIVDPIKTANEMIPKLKAKGAQIIIAITHLGFGADTILVKNTNGIDVIIGGHSHTTLKNGYRVKGRKTLIVQTGAFLNNIGILTIRYNAGKNKISTVSDKLVPLWEKQFGQDPKIAKIVEKYVKQVGAKMDAVIGAAEITITRYTDGTIESPLGNWITDVMREWANADVAFQNSGGIRADMLQGPITIRNIYTICPFDNSLVTMELTGNQLKQLIEHSLVHEYGGLQMSGLKVYYDSAKPAFQKVTKILIQGEPLNTSKSYRIVTNSFLAYGGEGYKILSSGKNMKDSMFMEKSKVKGNIYERMGHFIMGIGRIIK